MPPEEARRWFGYLDQPNFPPRYNIAPTQPVAIVRERPGADGVERRFALIRWGFLPAFVKDPRSFPLIFNARAESLREKASFSAAMKRRRCLFVADGFYEWRSDARRARSRDAFPFRRADGAPIGFARVWESWSGPNGEEVDTACIVTTAANRATACVHDRLPAMIERKDFARWLAADETAAADAFSLLAPAPDDLLTFFEIGPEVNDARNEGPQLQRLSAPGEPASTVQPSLF